MLQSSNSSFNSSCPIPQSWLLCQCHCCVGPTVCICSTSQTGDDSWLKAILARLRLPVLFVNSRPVPCVGKDEQEQGSRVGTSSWMCCITPKACSAQAETGAAAVTVLCGGAESRYPPRGADSFQLSESLAQHGEGS